MRIQITEAENGHTSVKVDGRRSIRLFPAFHFRKNPEKYLFFCLKSL